MSEGSKPNKNLKLQANDPRESNMEKSNAMPDFIAKSSHPGVAMLHIIMKLLLVFLYLVLPLITSPFNVLLFVVILGAIDFWIVKNVTGRLLVGLRWWIDFDQDGQQQWKFECKVDQKENSGASDKAFWWSLVLFTLIWLVFTVINVLKFNLTHITICVFCSVLLIFNLYSYYKCSKVQKQNVTKLLHQYGAEAAAGYMRGSIISQFK